MKIWIIIFVVGLLTFLMRYLPMNSPFFQRLKFIKHEAFIMLPICILAALVGPTFLFVFKNNSNNILPLAFAMGGAATFYFTRKMKSIIWGASIGYVLFVAIDYAFHHLNNFY